MLSCRHRAQNPADLTDGSRPFTNRQLALPVDYAITAAHLGKNTAGKLL
jgi:hypothetical protein